MNRYRFRLNVNTYFCFRELVLLSCSNPTPIIRGTAMAREEKQLEILLDAVLNRLNDLKKAVASMLRKVETEYETINWPTFLDNFALISSHVSPFSYPQLLSPLTLLTLSSSPASPRSFPTRWRPL